MVQKSGLEKDCRFIATANWRHLSLFSVLTLDSHISSSYSFKELFFLLLWSRLTVARVQAPIQGQCLMVAVRREAHIGVKLLNVVKKCHSQKNQLLASLLLCFQNKRVSPPPFDSSSHLLNLFLFFFESNFCSLFNFSR